MKPFGIIRIVCQDHAVCGIACSGHESADEYGGSELAGSRILSYTGAARISCRPVEQRSLRRIIPVEIENRSFLIRFAQLPRRVMGKAQTHVEGQPPIHFPRVLGEPFQKVIDTPAADSECRLDIRNEVSGERIRECPIGIERVIRVAAEVEAA